MIEKPNVSIMRRIAWRARTNSSNLGIGHQVFRILIYQVNIIDLKEQGDSTTNIVLGQEKKNLINQKIVCDCISSSLIFTYEIRNTRRKIIINWLLETMFRTLNRIENTIFIATLDVICIDACLQRKHTKTEIIEKSEFSAIRIMCKHAHS